MKINEKNKEGVIIKLPHLDVYALYNAVQTIILNYSFIETKTLNSNPEEIGDLLDKLETIISKLR